MDNLKRDGLAHALHIGTWDFGGAEGHGLPGVWLVDDSRCEHVIELLHSGLPEGWKSWETPPIARVLVVGFTVPETMELFGITYRIALTRTLEGKACVCHGLDEECPWCEGSGDLGFGWEDSLGLLLPVTELP